MSFKSVAAAFGIAASILIAGALPAAAASAYATTNVNVRSCDSTDCRVVDVLQRGERVEVDYCRGAWCAVEKRGRDGFVNANYLSRDYDDDDYYDDGDYYDDDFYIQPRRSYPRRIIRRYDPDFAACVGGPNARFCVYD
jgi:uncharacterized protein YraI